MPRLPVNQQSGDGCGHAGQDGGDGHGFARGVMPGYTCPLKADLGVWSEDWRMKAATGSRQTF